MNAPAVTAPVAAAPDKAQGVNWAEKRYLIVDDFVGIRQLLREALRSSWRMPTKSSTIR